MFERDVRDVSDLFALEDEVARAVAKRILQRVTMPALVPSTKNMAAYDAFLLGRTVQTRVVREDPERLAAAAGHFQRAVELDPEFAIAWARLAEVRFRLQLYRTDDGTSPDSPRYAVDRALALQPQLPLALGVRGFIRARGQTEIEETGHLRGRAKEEVAQGLRDLRIAEELGGPNAETRMARFLVGMYAGESLDLATLGRDALARDPENIERLAIVRPAMRFFGEFAEVDRLCLQALEVGGAAAANSVFIERVYNRQRWRGAEAALRLAEASPDYPGALGARVHMLAALGRATEAVKLIEAADPKHITWEMCADAGLMDRARELAAKALPGVRDIFEQSAPRRYVQWDGLRSNLIRLEIVAGQHESAVSHLDEWRQDVAQRTQNRRSGGILANMPVYYAALGKHDTAIELLQQRVGDGVALGHELRDPLRYGSMQSDPRFQALQRQADAWAASQPDPLD